MPLQRRRRLERGSEAKNDRGRACPNPNASRTSLCDGANTQGLHVARREPPAAAHGRALWQAESYDHWVRDGKELERIRDNIENKPRELGLVARPADYPDQRQKAEMNLGSAGWQPAPR